MGAACAAWRGHSAARHRRRLDLPRRTRRDGRILQAAEADTRVSRRQRWAGGHSMLKGHIAPTLDQITIDNGVGQVVAAQYKYLPALGIELMESPEGADVIAAHIQQGDLPRIDVLHCHGLYWYDTEHAQYQTWHHE